jgi:hypothetical protein
VAPGREVHLRTRVHNYSLVDFDAPTTVSFYDGDPDAGGSLIGSQTIRSIPARSTVEIPNPVDWTIPAMTTAQFDRTRVYPEAFGSGLPGYFGPNFLIAPEPGTSLLRSAALVGLAGLAVRRRRQQRARVGG